MKPWEKTKLLTLNCHDQYLNDVKFLQKSEVDASVE